LEQLIEVAQHYELPMGIEWFDRPGAEKTAVILSLTSDSMTVRDLIQTILLQSQDHQLSAENGIIHINHPTLMTDPKNLLNLLRFAFALALKIAISARYLLALIVSMQAQIVIVFLAASSQRQRKA
jgi:hypothetical protein